MADKMSKDEALRMLEAVAKGVEKGVSYRSDASVIRLAIAALSAREGGEVVGVVGPVTRGYSRVTLFNGDLPDGTELFLHPAQSASQQGEKVRGLVEKWRATASNLERDHAGDERADGIVDAMTQCADELAAALDQEKNDAPA